MGLRFEPYLPQRNTDGYVEAFSMSNFLAGKIGTPPAANPVLTPPAGLIFGRHDFTTFRSAHCQSQSPVKTLDELDVRRHGDELHIEAAARSFLHHQVRSMVGCLAMVGRGQWSPTDIGKALEARDRSALGLNAPPQGLYFVEAIYP